MEKTSDKKINPILAAIMAAVFYGISAPFSKILLREISPLMMAALLYLGAGLGMFIINIIKTFAKKDRSEAKLSKKELPYIILMILLDVAAPIFLMLGLKMTTAGSTSLLNNFEIVATSLIALVIFKEAVGKRMWLAILLITIASILLSVEDISNFSFSIGSLLVILACISWGFENNCTRKLSLKDPIQIVIIKGFGSGACALAIAFFTNSVQTTLPYLLAALVLGFLTYGMSILFYIYAQRDLGAARTSAYYAAAPFVGVALSWLILRENFTASFFIALVIMIAGTYFAVTERHKHLHTHIKTVHEHKHTHDAHHAHLHEGKVDGEHSHMHTHEEFTHEHEHTPDIHHRHKH